MIGRSNGKRILDFFVIADSPVRLCLRIVGFQGKGPCSPRRWMHLYVWTRSHRAAIGKA